MEKSLREIFTKNKIKLDDFVKTTGISRTRLHTYLNRDLDKFKIHEVALLCNLLPVTPELFGMNNSIFKFKKDRSYQSLLSYSYLRSIGEIHNYTEFIELYFEAIIQQIKLAKNRIIILDYVGNNLFLSKKVKESGDGLKMFEKNYKLFLNAISDFIEMKKEENDSYKDTPIEPVFIRILQTPITPLNNYYSFNKQIDTVLDLSYNEMFVQFERLYKKGYKDYFKLFWTNTPSRPYNVLIIDDDRILTEDFRYNESFDAIPDVIFIDKKMSNESYDIANVMINTHLESISKIINDKEKEIYRELAYSRLGIIYKRYEKKCEKLKNDIEYLKKIKVEKTIDLAEGKNKNQTFFGEELIKEINELEDEIRINSRQYHILKEREELSEMKISNFNWSKKHR